MKPLDIVILAVVAVLLFLAIRYAVRHREDGCDGNCGSSCSSCPYSGKCRRVKKKP